MAVEINAAESERCCRESVRSCCRALRRVNDLVAIRYAAVIAIPCVQARDCAVRFVARRSWAAQFVLRIANCSRAAHCEAAGRY